MTTYSLHLSPESAQFGRKYVWEVPVRVCHWVGAAAVVTLFATGMFISWPVFSSNGEPYQHFLMGRFRQVHFVSGYVLLTSLLLRGYWFFKGNKYARSGVPLIWRKEWRKALFEQVHEYMGLERGAVRLGHTSLAGLAYFVMVGGLGGLQVLTGFAMYGQNNPGGFWDRALGWVIPLFGVFSACTCGTTCSPGDSWCS